MLTESIARIYLFERSDESVFEGRRIRGKIYSCLGAEEYGKQLDLRKTTCSEQKSRFGEEVGWLSGREAVRLGMYISTA